MVQIGDLVSKAGIYSKPGVVVEKKDDGSVVIDTEPMNINKYHRYSNTTGLSEEEKLEFNSILDDIFRNPDDMGRANEIQNQIDRLRTHPKNMGVVQYLRNQQRQLMRKAQDQPRIYQWDEGLLDEGKMSVKK